MGLPGGLLRGALAGVSALDMGVRNRLARCPSLAFLSSRKEPGWY